MQSLVALGLLVVAAIVAGLTLGESRDRLEELPGLLLMVPAAIALRGNIFGALGSRLGTSIHAGTFRLSVRPSTVVGENLLASVVLTLGASVALAALAKGTAVAFGVADSISLGAFVVISLVGGVLASAAVLVVALLLAAGSVRYGWDPDNVTAPLVTAVGDVATVPALVLAAGIVGSPDTTNLFAAALIAASIVVSVLAVRFGRPGFRSILVESLPVLLIALVLDLIAGVGIEKRVDEFVELPTLLVLLPAYLAAAGALGGILSSRLSSKLHLGTIRPSAVPGARARTDLIATLIVALPVFAFSGWLAHVLAEISDLEGPGLASTISIALVGGLVATAVAMVVAYYGTIVSVRSGLDPDTYGIPLVTSTLDLVGVFTFIIAVEALGVV